MCVGQQLLQEMLKIYIISGVDILQTVLSLFPTAVPVERLPPRFLKRHTSPRNYCAWNTPLIVKTADHSTRNEGKRGIMR